MQILKDTPQYITSLHAAEFTKQSTYFGESNQGKTQPYRNSQ